MRLLNNISPIGVILTILFVLWGCASKPLPSVIYPRMVFPFNRYPIISETAGIKVAAIPFEPGRDIYADPAKPSAEKPGLPFNILETKVLPVRLVILNQSEDEILLDPDQITGIAGEITYFRYSPQEAVDLILQSDAYKKAIKGSEVGPFIKSILGGDIIIGAIREGVGGLASGGVTGGASGVAKGATGVSVEQALSYEKSLKELVSREYTAQALKRQSLFPGFITDGLIFLPGRVGISRIRIQAYNIQTKKPVTLILEIRR